MDFLSIVPATALGYLTFRVTTHPTAKIRRKMPNIKNNRVQIFPVLRFYMFGRVIHFHHWFNFSILLVFSIFATSGILDYMVTKGVLLGGILHGLSLPREHRTMIYKDFSVERLTSLQK